MILNSTRAPKISKIYFWFQIIIARFGCINIWVKMKTIPYYYKINHSLHIRHCRKLENKIMRFIDWQTNLARWAKPSVRKQHSITRHSRIRLSAQQMFRCQMKTSSCSSPSCRLSASPLPIAESCYYYPTRSGRMHAVEQCCNPS